MRALSTDASAVEVAHATASRCFLAIAWKTISSMSECWRASSRLWNARARGSDSVQVRQKLREIARDMASSHRGPDRVGPLPPSGRNVDVISKGAQGKTADETASLVAGRANSERDRVAHALGPDAVDASVQSRVRAITRSLDEDTEDWKSSVPGK